NGQDGDNFEFVELKNAGSQTLDLSGVHFTDAINFSFPIGSTLAAGQFAVLVSDPAAFGAKYPGITIAGTYQGHLSNSGEKLTVVHASGEVISSVDFRDGPPWPIAADGNGFSLVPVNSNFNPDPNNAANWRASSKIGGSPGAD